MKNHWITILLLSGCCLLGNSYSLAQSEKDSDTQSVEAIAAQVREINLNDFEFNQYVDLVLLSDAAASLDPGELTDAALLFARAEKILNRKHLSGIESEALFMLAANAAEVKGAKATLERLQKAAGRDGLGELAAKVKIAIQLGGTRAPVADDQAVLEEALAKVQAAEQEQRKRVGTGVSEASLAGLDALMNTNILTTRGGGQKWTLGVDTGAFHKGFGLEVTHVYPNSAAADAGIYAGDYLHSINGSVPTQKRDFATLLRTEPDHNGKITLLWFGEDPSSSTGIEEFKENVYLKRTNAGGGHSAPGGGHGGHGGGGDSLEDALLGAILIGVIDEALNGGGTGPEPTHFSMENRGPGWQTFLAGACDAATLTIGTTEQFTIDGSEYVEVRRNGFASDPSTIRIRHRGGSPIRVRNLKTGQTRTMNSGQRDFTIPVGGGLSVRQ